MNIRRFGAGRPCQPWVAALAPGDPGQRVGQQLIGKVGESGPVWVFPRRVDGRGVEGAQPRGLAPPAGGGEANGDTMTFTTPAEEVPDP